MTDIVIATESGEVPQDNEDKAKQLPQPSGYHILVAIPEAEEKFESGLIKSDETRRIGADSGDDLGVGKPRE
jgi:hypothetical protein